MTSRRESLLGLRSEDPEERRRATSGLLDFESESVAELVTVAMSDEDWRVRKEAIVVALSLAPSSAMLEQLVGCFATSQNVGLRNAAVEALGGYGEAAVRALSIALPGMDADARKLTAEALGRGGQPAALSVLERLARDQDANVRLAAVEAIAVLGSFGVLEASRILKSYLASPEPLVVLAALMGLNALGSVLSWEHLEPCLSSPMLRRAAIAALARSADPRGVRTLLQALESADGADFTDALSALGTFVTDREALETVAAHARNVSVATGRRLIELALLDDTADELRRAAMLVAAAVGASGAADCALSLLAVERFLADAHMALAALGEAAVPALVVGAAAEDEVVRASALRLLAGLPSLSEPAQVTSAARASLFATSSDVISEALSLLARFGDASCLTDLAECLERVPRGTLKAAEAALSSLSLRYPKAARHLALNAAPDARSAHAACVLIRSLGPNLLGSAEADLRFLSEALSNPSGAVRCAAVEALTDLGGTRAAEAVAFASTDEEREVRRAAVAALGRMRAEDGAPVGVPRLVELVERSSDPELLQFAIRALSETQSAEATEVLRPLLRSPQPLIAVCAVEALAELSRDSPADALFDGLLHADPEVVKAAMQALSEKPNPRVVAQLGVCLEHEAWDVRRLAADLLGRVSGDVALSLLRTRLPREDSPTVQAAIARALERIAGIRRTPPPGSFRPR